MSKNTTQSITVAPPDSANTPYQAKSGQAQEPIELEESTRVRNDIGDILPQDFSVSINAVDALEKWNNPRRNIFCLIATYTSFFVLGLNDASLGVSACLTPYLQNTTLTVHRP